MLSRLVTLFSLYIIVSYVCIVQQGTDCELCVQFTDCLI